MNPAALLQSQGAFVLLFAVFGLGVATALSGRDWAKRLAGLCVGLAAAVGFSAASSFSWGGAQSGAPLATPLVVVTFAYGAVGLALILRLKDQYGQIDAAEIAADDDDDDVADRTP